MKRLLIISPYFPPSNGADTQRIRMSAGYFAEFGWTPEIVTVDPVYSEMQKDPLLVESLPEGLIVHNIKALDKRITSKFGLGSLGLRSLLYYKEKVDSLLRNRSYDLVYFSTTQFAVCSLGPYWKRKFDIPFVIDFQDPWHSEYYRDKPAHQRPPKYWFSYRLNKYLEPRTLKQAGGLISVSEQYISDLKQRYPVIAGIPAATITFGAFEPDLRIAARHFSSFPELLTKDCVNLVYIGRGGADMRQAVSVLFQALQDCLADNYTVFSRLRVYFIGTSYAAGNRAKATILPLARDFGLDNLVIEITDRISYYHTLATLQQADALFIPGSDDPKYTASKIHPYLLTGKPVLAIFHPKSPAIASLREYGAPYVMHYEAPEAPANATVFLQKLMFGELDKVHYHHAAIEKYSARHTTAEQCALFDRVIEKPLRTS